MKRRKPFTAQVTIWEASKQREPVGVAVHTGEWDYLDDIGHNRSNEDMALQAWYRGYKDHVVEIGRERFYVHTWCGMPAAEPL